MKKAILLFFILYLPLCAQWSSEPAQNLQISNFGYYVDACEDGNGGAFVCWRTTADNPTVWVQWVDKFGYARWPQPVQVTGAGLGQTNNRIIKTSDNAAVIAFGDQYVGETFDVPPWVIYKTYITLNKIDTTGTLLWGENGVRATVDTAQQQDLVIIPDESGGAYLTWNDRFPVWSDPDSMIIRLQRISYEGQRMWGDSGRYIYKAPQYQYPKPFVNNRLPDGIFFVHGETSGVTMESIEPDGLINWSRVNNWYGRPIPVNDGGGAWTLLHYNPNNGLRQLMANRMDSAGNFVWSDSGLVIADNLSSVSSVVDIKLLMDNSLIVFWKRQHKINYNDYKSYIQIVDINGVFIFPDSSKPITTSSDGKIIGTGLQLSDSLNFILNWQDTRTTEPGFYVQKYNNKMEKLWDENDILYSTHGIALGAFLNDYKHGIITIWGEFFSPNVGVFAQQVSKDGKLGEVVTGIENIPEKRPDRFKLFQNYPNPFNSITMISFILPAKSHVKIIVYNAIGQKVKELFNGDKQSGYHRVIWNGADQNNRPVSSGVYYIKLESDNKQQIIKTLLIK